MTFSPHRTLCAVLIFAALTLPVTIARAAQPLEQLASLDGWKVLKEPFGQRVRIEGASRHALVCEPNQIALETRLDLWIDPLGSSQPDGASEPPGFADIRSLVQTPTSELEIQSTTHLMIVTLGRMKVGTRIFDEMSFSADVLRERPGPKGSQIWALVKTGLHGEQVAALRDAKSSVWLDAPGLRRAIQKEMTASSPKWQRFDEHFGIHDAAKAYRPHDDPIGPIDLDGIDKAIDFTDGVCSNPQWPAARGLLDRLPSLWK